MPKSIKILLVDDHKMILDSLKLLFGMIDDFEIVGTLDDSRKVITFLSSEEVDVVVTDYRMPYIDGLQLTQMIKEQYPDIKVLILSVNEDAKDIQDAYRAGANGYIMKKASRKELDMAVHKIADGEFYYSQDAMQAMLNPVGSRDDTQALHQKASVLTKRELEIVRLLVKEMSSNEIGEALHISTGTVETHRHNILRKLNVKSTIGVIKFAIKAGIAD